MVKERRYALVLSGGSIKGAFQAGALRAVLESGFVPDFIYGISVGALNGSFLCNESGSESRNGGTVNWKIVGEKLFTFWKENVKQPSDLVTERSWLELGASALFDSFAGLVDTSPLRKLVSDKLNLDFIRASKTNLKVGAVDLIDGEITYADPSSDVFLEYVLASASTPIVMPVVRIGGKPYADGGVREIAPLKVAIDSGATDIVVVACESKNMQVASIDTGNIVQLIERVFDVMTNAIVDDDVGLAEFLNGSLPKTGVSRKAGPLAGYRRVNIKVIRPASPINLDIRKFTESDIGNLLNQGYEAGKGVWV